jgi:hypothetical protein
MARMKTLSVLIPAEVPNTDRVANAVEVALHQVLPNFPFVRVKDGDEAGSFLVVADLSVPANPALFPLVSDLVCERAGYQLKISFQ